MLALLRTGRSWVPVCVCAVVIGGASPLALGVTYQPWLGFLGGLSTFPEEDLQELHDATSWGLALGLDLVPDLSVAIAYERLGFGAAIRNETGSFNVDQPVHLLRLLLNLHLVAGGRAKYGLGIGAGWYFEGGRVGYDSGLYRGTSIEHRSSGLLLEAFGHAEVRLAGRWSLM